MAWDVILKDLIIDQGPREKEEAKIYQLKRKKREPYLTFEKPVVQQLLSISLINKHREYLGQQNARRWANRGLKVQWLG